MAGNWGTYDFYNRFRNISDLVAFNPLIDYLWNDTDISYVESFTCPQQYQRLVVGADGLVMKCSNDEENKSYWNLNTETVYEVCGEKMAAIAKIILWKRFLKMKYEKCYLPETKMNCIQ